MKMKRRKIDLEFTLKDLCEIRDILPARLKDKFGGIILVHQANCRLIDKLGLADNLIDEIKAIVEEEMINIA